MRAPMPESPVRSPVLRHLPQGVVVALGTCFVTTIAVADWVTGPTVSLDVVYAVAVIAATWVGGRSHGLLAAGLAAVDSLAASVAHLDPIALDPGALWNGCSRFAGLWLIAALVGRLRASLMLQRHQAMTDALTGVLNRRAFYIAAERERLRAEREHQPITIAYLDLDGFKSINDRLGHGSGDAILTSFAETVSSLLRGSDLVARIGGDEFTILLPNTDARNAVQALTRVRRALVERNAVNPTEAVTMSTGLATYHKVPTTVDEMIDEADRLMYRAKDNGRDRIVGSVISGPWRRWGDRARIDGRTVAAEVE